MKIGRGRSQHLDIAGLEDQTAACLVCGCTAARERVFLVQADPDVHLLRCPRCQACSASHMPTPKVLSDFYSDYYEHRAKEHGVTFAEPVRFARHVLRGLPR